MRVPVTSLAAFLPLLAAVAARSVRPQGSFDGGDNAYPYQPVVPYYEAPVQECPETAPAEVDLDEVLYVAAWLRRRSLKDAF